MPRPKKPQDERLRRIIKFRVTDAEFDALRREAEAVGLSAHECARMKATGTMPVVVSSAQAEPPGMFELRTELRRVGVNMNQIARRLNMSGEHYPDELRDASKHLDEILLEILAAGEIR